ncbi:MAG: hypothetical protein IPO43_04170 [Rhodoferax sp.]|nr:hypothetical protein [Rhodoferax sp.]
MTQPKATHTLLVAQRAHLGDLLEAIQRCVYFLHASDASLPWPLSGETLSSRKKDASLFEALAAVNERFSKLQDTLGSAMRHSLLLSGEQADSFLKVLAIFEKLGVVISIDDWQTARSARNLAAHDYETDYQIVAEHFNTLHALQPDLYCVAARFVRYCETELHVPPSSSDFSIEFHQITRPE